MADPRNPPRIVFRGSRFSVERIVQPVADGGVHERDVVRHAGAAVVVPMVDADHVCLIRNERIAVGRTLIELPAGTLEPGEDPAETARRELAEETGYRAGSIEFLHAFFPSPGILDERMQLFLATDLEAGTAEREASEQIQNLVVAWDEAMALIDERKIEDAKTIAGLFLYDRMRRQRKREGN